MKERLSVIAAVIVFVAAVAVVVVYVVTVAALREKCQTIFFFIDLVEN